MVRSAPARTPISSFCRMSSCWLKSPSATFPAKPAAKRSGLVRLSENIHSAPMPAKATSRPKPSCQKTPCLAREVKSSFRALASASTTSVGSWMTTDQGLPVRPRVMGA